MLVHVCTLKRAVLSSFENADSAGASMAEGKGKEILAASNLISE